MTLQQLKYIIEIVNSGSINEAAKKLYITQPSLSSAVKELESEMGIELFLRTPKGITLTSDGAEFLGYARQVVEQASLLEQRYLNKKPARQLCSISTQHYAFAVNAFVNMIQKSGADEYEFTLRETRTYEIIEDVKTLRSELGILYRNPFNQKVIDKLLKENHLEFHPLFTAEPHIFTSSSNPLAKRPSVTLEDLEEYPYLMIGLDGYTISTGIVSADLNGDNITSVPLIVDDKIQVGWISNRQIQLSKQALSYVEELRDVISGYGLTLEE